jgi:hypothetical protein
VISRSITEHNKKSQSLSGQGNTAVAVDGAGNLLLATEFAGVLDFEGHQFVSSGIQQGCPGTQAVQPPDLLVVKYDAQGNTRWAQQLGGAGEEHIDAVALGDDGTAYVLGTSTVTSVYNGILLDIPDAEVGTPHRFMLSIPDLGGTAPTYRSLTTGLPPRLDCPTPRNVITRTWAATESDGIPVFFEWAGSFGFPPESKQLTLDLDSPNAPYPPYADVACTVNALVNDQPGDVLIGPFTPPIEITIPMGDTITTCKYTVTGDPTAELEEDVLIATVADTDPPVFSFDPFKGTSAEATGPNGAVVTFDVSAVDYIDGPVPFTCSPAPGSVFPIGFTEVDCTASDKSSNQASGTYFVTVKDTTPPALHLPASLATAATSTQGAVVTLPVTATDLVDGTVPVTCTPASGAKFPLGPTTVSCSATDRHQNTASGTFAVDVTYSWSGLLPPIKPQGTSTFKQGSIVPVKFQLTGASARANPVARISATGGGKTYVTSARALRLGSTYLYLLDTRHMAGQVTIAVDLGDQAVRTTTITVVPR